MFTTSSRSVDLMVLVLTNNTILGFVFTVQYVLAKTPNLYSDHYPMAKPGSNQMRYIRFYPVRTRYVTVLTLPRDKVTPLMLLFQLWLFQYCWNKHFLRGGDVYEKLNTRAFAMRSPNSIWNTLRMSKYLLFEKRKRKNVLFESQDLNHWFYVSFVFEVLLFFINRTRTHCSTLSLCWRRLFLYSSKLVWRDRFHSPTISLAQTWRDAYTQAIPPPTHAVSRILWLSQNHQRLEFCCFSLTSFNLSLPVSTEHEKLRVKLELYS